MKKEVLILFLVFIFLCANVSASYKSGDANGDGEVSIEDAEYLVEWIFNNGPAPVSMTAADFNKDGEVNITDAVAIIQYVRAHEGDDKNAPEIELYKPRDGKTFHVDRNDEEEVEFEYEVYDDSKIEYCSLVVEGRVKKTYSSIDREERLSFERDFDDGDYDWKIKCEDIYGNVGYSERWEFEVEEDEDPYSSSGRNLLLMPYEEPQEKTIVRYTKLPEEKETKNSERYQDQDLWPVMLIVLAVGVLLMLVLIFVVSKRGRV